MKKKVAIVFGITFDYVFALANVLIGMKKHDIFWDDIIVYHDNVDLIEQKKINKILPCIFRRISMEKFKGEVNQESITTYSYLAMARFECFDLLRDYEYVIWHDVDILIQKDFSDLLDSAKETGLALTYDCKFSVEQNFWNAQIEGYNLLKPLYNSGIMVLSDILGQYDGMTAYCYNKFTENSNNLRYLDQAILNMLVQDYDIKVGYISLDDYCCHPSKKNYREAKIIHAYGNQKFWNSDIRKVQFPEWIENNRVWENIELENQEDMERNNIETIISCILYVSSETEIDYNAIKSVLNQVEINMYFHVVIEYSSQQHHIKNSFLKKCSDERLRITCNSKYKGKKSSYLAIINKVEGKYVAFLDGKTYSMPNRFSKQVALLEMKPDVIAIGTNAIVNGKEKIMPQEYKKIKAMSLFQPAILDKTVVFRKSALLRIVKLEETLDEDTFWNQLLKQGVVENIDETLVIEEFGVQDDFGNKLKRPNGKKIKNTQQNIKNTFGIGLTYDEAMLLICPEIIETCYNAAYFQKKRYELINQILNENRKTNIYDQSCLVEYLKKENLPQGEVEKRRENLLKKITRNIAKRKVILWGTGKRCWKYITQYPDFPIEFCVDNDIAKKDSKIENIKIKHVTDIKDWKAFFVIVTPVRCDEIGKQLEGYGLAYGTDFAWGKDIF